MAEELGDADGGYWARPELEVAILAALQEAGKALDALTVDDLDIFDQFHNGGKAATVALAKRSQVRAGSRVLDVGGGLGGPARTLAAEFGCDVTVLDVTRDYLRAGEALTARLGLQNRVQFRYGSALDLPFDDGGFDLVWTQNSGMQIEDKGALYGELFRVLRPGGCLATQEPAAGMAGPPYFPMMWSRDGSSSFLLTPSALRVLIAAAGFRELDWEEITTQRPIPAQSTTTLQQLVMGDRLPEIQRTGARNWQERRLAAIEAVFERPG